MNQSGDLKRIPAIVLTLLLACASMPYLLGLIGVNYGPAARGGAGSHFAGFQLNHFLVRMDVAAAGLLVLLTTLGVLFAKISQSRFVTIMTASLIMGGLSLAVQLVPFPDPSNEAAPFFIQVVRSTTLGYVGMGLLLLNGAFFVRFGIRGSTLLDLGPVLTTGFIILGGTWTLMAGSFDQLVGHHSHLQLVAIGLHLAAVVVLRPPFSPQVLHFFKLGLVGLIIPQVAGLLWLHLGTESIFDQGFHIATLLWWMALLLPVLGLGIDLINVNYSKGQADEKHYLRQVIDSIPHFIFARNSQGVFTLVNKAVAKFYNLRANQVVGRSLADIHLDLEQTEEWLKEDQQVLESNSKESIEATMTRDAQGNPIWIDAVKTPLVGSSGQREVLGVSIDITPQKSAELALAQRLRFEQIATTVLRKFIKCQVDNFDHSMERILHIVGSFTSANQCFIYRHFEEDESAHLMHSWCSSRSGSGFELPSVLEGPQAQWVSCTFSSGQPISSFRATDLPDELDPFLKAWGCPHDHGVYLMPIFNQKTLFGFLGIQTSRQEDWLPEETVFLRNLVALFITVWDKLETEKSLTRAMKEAQDSNRAKTEFLANMSHEIRTPMNCVIGISELLREMDPTSAQKQYLEMISQSGASLLALINDVLDLSKIEAGQLELDPNQTNLRNLVEEAVGLIAFNAQAKGLEMVCRYAPGAPDMVICDPNRLRQVLTNLLNNAFKFTTDGHIYLNVEPVGSKDGKLQMQFRVSDTGIGIPQQKLEKIFDKFTQADTSTTRRFGGTGLGLSISQQLIELMGGQIKAESVEGKGSTFTFTVPVEEVEGTLQAPAHVAKPNSTMLVISSHQLGCEVLAEQVRHLGYECTTALGCQQGLHLIDQMSDKNHKPYSFILVDQDVLPQDTPLIVDFLNNLPEDSRPTPILLTSLSSIIRESDLARSGFASTLTKPVRPSRLAEVLNGNDGFLLIDTMAETAGRQATLMEAVELGLDQEDAFVHEEQPFILLAEDNPFNQKVAMGMLKLLGCQVHVANNGTEALHMVQKQKYDVVFMDCQMPEMDGYEATRQIRQLSGKAGETTIIAMTANALSGDRNACFESGMNDFLSKPITKAMLSDMLEKWELLQAPINQ